MTIYMEWTYEGSPNDNGSVGADGIFTCYKESIHDGV